jgi:hypothetical protein
MSKVVVFPKRKCPPGVVISCTQYVPVYFTCQPKVLITELTCLMGES